ncbi:hypothetical protein NEOLI_004420 [Neolecta irregularis DAH-3]|uniref:Uncharacterized protein n=1 Tax=Neolecta irregularis (strain DAH-3) TaxID=1198029 RepID=A0A1U7LLR4_NEOID|nr:hypothetical protein NEOLI_004420 [Neolecta irregularis DAH-3]|eukprot:OLL23606.1 hypothetical protein NEOLI_004420 [Neolecta irregularis DAH-3]
MEKKDLSQVRKTAYLLEYQTVPLEMFLVSILLIWTVAATLPGKVTIEQNTSQAQSLYTAPKTLEDRQSFVDKRVFELSQFIKNPPPEGMPLCQTNEFKNKSGYGASYKIISIILDGCEQLKRGAKSNRYRALQDRRQKLRDSLQLLFLGKSLNKYRNEALKIIEALSPSLDSPFKWAEQSFLPIVRPFPNAFNTQKLEHENLKYENFERWNLFTPKDNLNIPINEFISHSLETPQTSVRLGQQSPTTLGASSTFDPAHEMKVVHDLGPANAPASRPSKRGRPRAVQPVMSDERTLNEMLWKRLKQSFNTMPSTVLEKYEIDLTIDNQSTPRPIGSGDIIGINSGDTAPFTKIKTQAPSVVFSQAPQSNVPRMAMRDVLIPPAKRHSASPFISLEDYTDHLQLQSLTRNDVTWLRPQASHQHASCLDIFPSNEASPSPGLETSESVILSSSADKWDGEEHLYFLHDKVSLLK